MTSEEARALALSLPETTEEPHFEKASFRVRGRIFATLPPAGEHLHVFLEEPSVRAVVAEEGSGCQELWWGRKLCGVRVLLEGADAQVVTELLEEAWRRKAPKRLADALHAR